MAHPACATGGTVWSGSGFMNAPYTASHDADAATALKRLNPRLKSSKILLS